jgi:hypothetical protein
MTIAEQVEKAGITSTDPMWELVSMYLGVPMPVPVVVAGSTSTIPPTPIPLPSPPPPYGWYNA